MKAIYRYICINKMYSARGNGEYMRIEIAGTTLEISVTPKARRVKVWVDGKRVIA
jgi:hypothetical protein